MMTETERTAANDDDPGSCTEGEGEQPPSPGSCEAGFVYAAPGADAQVEVHVQPVDGRQLDGHWLADRLAAALRAIPDLVARRVTVLVVNDDRMRRLHGRHLGKTETTDVLTFEESTPGASAGAGLAVDIAVCVDEAYRRAADLGHTPEQELLLYAIHGVLHGLGYDDHAADERKAMHAEEDRILEAIGVGRTFDPGAQADR